MGHLFFLRPLLIAGAFLFSQMPADADPVAPASLVPALELYADSLAFGHAAAAVCAEAEFKAVNDDQWSRARDMLLATLWANGFPADVVNDLTRRLAAPPPSEKPDCSDPAVKGSFSTAEQTGWQMEVGNTIDGLELVPVFRPVGASQWQAIKDLIAGDLPDETRMLDCIEAIYPELMPRVVHDWDATIVKLAEKFVAAGLPRDEITATLSAAEANSLWHRTPPDALVALANSCAADETWSDRMYNLEGLGGKTGDAIDKLLPPPADTAN